MNSKKCPTLAQMIRGFDALPLERQLYATVEARQELRPLKPGQTRIGRLVESLEAEANVIHECDYGDGWELSLVEFDGEDAGEWSFESLPMPGDTLGFFDEFDTEAKVLEVSDINYRTKTATVKIDWI